MTRQHSLDERTWRQVARDLQNDGALRIALTRKVAAGQAVFFECEPVRRSTIDQPFRFVLLESQAVARLRPDPSAFQEHLRHPVAVFWNLGRDAVLVAPGGAIPADCAHLAAWARSAPEGELHGLWSAVGREVEAWWAATEAPLWLSTSGLGVPWLHVRLDSRPKYITHKPYQGVPCP